MQKLYSNLFDSEELLYRRCDEVLHYLWDPIGVCESPGARDEYYSYLPKLVELLQSNTDAPTIATYLDEIAERRMLLPADRNKSLRIAEILIESCSFYRSSWNSVTLG